MWCKVGDTIRGQPGNFYVITEIVSWSDDDGQVYASKILPGGVLDEPAYWGTVKGFAASNPDLAN